MKYKNEVIESKESILARAEESIREKGYFLIETALAENWNLNEHDAMIHLYDHQPDNFCITNDISDSGIYLWYVTKMDYLNRKKLLTRFESVNRRIIETRDKPSFEHQILLRVIEDIEVKDDRMFSSTNMFDFAFGIAQEAMAAGFAGNKTINGKTLEDHIGILLDDTEGS